MALSLTRLLHVFPFAVACVVGASASIFDCASHTLDLSPEYTTLSGLDGLSCEFASGTSSTMDIINANLTRPFSLDEFGAFDHGLSSVHQSAQIGALSAILPGLSAGSNVNLTRAQTKAIARASGSKLPLYIKSETMQLECTLN